MKICDWKQKYYFLWFAKQVILYVRGHHDIW